MATPRKKPPTKRQKEYMTKLRDPRWQKKKNGVLDRDGYACTWCGSGLEGGRNLQVHHGYYSKGFEPWDYPDESLFTLCAPCHEQAEVLKQQLFEVQGYIPPQFHHHVFYFMQELLEALRAGQQIEALAARSQTEAA